jgi:uncharacterized protein YciI
MTFLLICRDRPEASGVRLANREAHLAYLKASGVVTLAGPLLDDAGAMTGSLLAIEVADRAAAQAFAAADPYAQAGLFAAVEIVGWKRVIG